MSVPNVSPSLPRSRSVLDHRAIDVAVRLLVAGIWLERQLENASRIGLLTPNQFLREKR
jgi:hypothetical protein